MTFDLKQFHSVFFDESAEHLANIEADLVRYDLANPDSDLQNAIFRAMHSIKGGAGTFGFRDVADLVHNAETLLDEVRKGKRPMTEQMVDLMLHLVDRLKEIFTALRAEEEVDVSANLEFQERLLAMLNGPVDIAPGAAPAALVMEEDASWGMFDDEPSPMGANVEPQGWGVFEDGPGAPSVKLDRVDSRVDSSSALPSGEGVAPGSIDPQLGTRADGTPMRARASDAAKGGGGESSSIRVGVEKVDQLLNLVGELVITQSMLAQSLQELEMATHEKLFSGVAQLERNSRELQEAVMSIRMMPISAVFSRYPRLVRDLAGKLGKKVELKLVGESTELDRGMIEKLSDPLTHLVRNSLDHGIESAEVRKAAGKNETGLLTLRAFQQGGQVVITVSDDGNGLHRDKILAKARERGLPVTDSMTDQEVWNLIFEPGFSTAAEVTDVSGRGVGMDVVRRNIQQMGGRIDIESLAGTGTSMTLRLPLTLAILDGMVIASGCETFIIPLSFIAESVQPQPGQVRSVTGKGRVLDVRGEYLPLVVLHEQFMIEPVRLRPEDALCVILELDSERVALQVDDLLGQQQVVIKNLETNYRRVKGVSGATIMGDGAVALILDVPALVKLSRHGEQREGVAA